MRHSIKERIICTVCAAAMLFSSFGSTAAAAVKASAEAGFFAAAPEQTADSGLTHHSLEIYPNGEDGEQVITLDGMMPEGAEAEAVDVSDEHEGIAYDITISDGGSEYQPEKNNPIFVEIMDPDIPDSGVELWHITDDGERQQITEFTLVSGKLSFYAEGFSVYEIVDDTITQTDRFFDDLAKKGAEGLYVPMIIGADPDPTNGPYYLKAGTYPNVCNTGRTGLNITEKSSSCPPDAVKLYFEREEGTQNKFYLYTMGDGGDRQYIRMFRETVFGSGRSALEYVSAAGRTLFTLEKNDDNQVRIYAALSDGKYYYWVRNTKEKKIAIVGYSSSNDSTLVWMDLNGLAENTDSLDLDGRSYGLMNFTGGTHGYAMVAEDSKVHTLVELVTHKEIDGDGNVSYDPDGKTLYVDEGSEVTDWTFHAAGENKYKLSAETKAGVKYLAVSGDDLTLADSAESGAEFTVTPDSSGKIQLSVDGKYVTFTSKDDEGVTSSDFVLSGNGSSPATWLSLLRFAHLSDSDLITYSADRISVSDAKNGQKVIVYTRLWDEVSKKYEMYAVDYNGTLYPCYASGGKILWLGDGTGSLEWEFTEYYDPVTKEPNYYYELYNPYSEKYIAPQISGEQVLSESSIGINMQGRRNGEFYSEIVAWDNTKYAYVGMKPNDEKTKLISCSQSSCIPFYFATLEPLSLSDSLHEVPTLDNNEHGITMKMVNFDISSGKKYADSNAGMVTNEFFGGNTSRQTGLLSNQLKANGYPDVAVSTRRDFGEAFQDSFYVNKLFLEKVYNSSGYFEFDSCQNFATVCDENGELTGLKNYSDGNGNTIPMREFTVYRELGTTAQVGKDSLRHGQFYPFDIITADKLVEKNNPLNLYSALASTGNNLKEGLLDDSDPRKYEPLHLIQSKRPNADYYFGMEMSASFVQTVSGLDAWGHDIIFEFKGDDDFWLYVDDELVLDLGGIHSAIEGKVNFRTGEVVYDLGSKHSETKGGKPNVKTTTLREVFEQNYKSRNPAATESEIQAYLSKYFADGETIFKDYTTHTMRVFYMERGAGASNLHMRFNIASVTPGHVVVSKTVEGKGADILDSDFLEYPFQIYYTLPEGEDGEPGEEHLLANDSEHIHVTYQNSNKPVTYVQKYRPPGFTEEQAYQSIYFINPSKNAEISFPDGTISYRLVECAVDSTIYGNVKINGEEVPADRVEIRGDLRSYSSEIGTAENKPNISFSNFVNDNVIKDLYITKKLLDENDNEVTDDPARFSFRLSISSVDVSADDLPLANMYKYYVLSPAKKLCRYDAGLNSFADTTLEYSHDIINQLRNDPLTPVGGVCYDDVTFTTSGFGAISGIPSGYTIVVPGLPAGTVFKVTEDVKAGYGLVGFERVMGDKTLEDGSTEDIPSYQEYDGNPLNVGKVIAEENPQLEVHNKKGYGLTVNKKWSDLSITTSHESVYTAVYVDGELLEGSVRQIKAPSTSAYYFWTSLKPNADGSERTSLDDYVIREVKLGSADPTVAADGTVTDYGTVTPLDDGDSIELTATRTAAATPSGEANDKVYEYIASYETDESDGTTRADTITNTRMGGLAVRLFKWNSIDPLKGGNFTLEDSSGNTVGRYTSDSDGIVTMMYDFETEKMYTLTQTSAPSGYVGLQKKVRFIVHDDETVSLFYNDGVTPWGQTDTQDLSWANGKKGRGGIVAFVDVYNKPFNFKIMKTDSEDASLKLGSAHFALYKQTNTTINGYEKNKSPMTGFEDLVTVGGTVDVCGGDSGRVINPGANGSVYFLTETKAPFNYNKLSDDIIFRISAIGVPSLISDSYNGQLVEEDDSYIYTLSVPNTKKDPDLDLLTIEKKVGGAFGNRNKEFSFTIEISNAGEGDDLVWAKNGEEQTAMPRTGGSFTMKHDDRIEIALPTGARVTITEDNAGYSTKFRLDDQDSVKDNTLSFDFSGAAKVVVTNTLDGDVATGVSSAFGSSLTVMLVPAVSIGLMLYCKRRRKRES